MGASSLRVTFSPTHHGEQGSSARSSGEDFEHGRPCTIREDPAPPLFGGQGEAPGWLQEAGNLLAGATGFAAAIVKSPPMNRWLAHTALAALVTSSLVTGCASREATSAEPAPGQARVAETSAATKATPPSATKEAEPAPAGKDEPASKSEGPSSAPTARPTYDKAPPVGNLDEYKKLQATIETERGNIVFTFFPSEAPHTVASFVKLSRDGFYNGLNFHRVEPGFVIQGGDPNGDGSGGPGFTLPAEFNDHKHLLGSVAMARTPDPNSAGSQFYICLNAIPSLDHEYTVFGQVTKGIETVKKIQVGDKILRVRITPISK